MLFWERPEEHFSTSLCHSLVHIYLYSALPDFCFSLVKPKLFELVSKFEYMRESIEIPLKEYELMKEEIALLKDNAFLEKLNRLVDILYEEKYGFYLGNNTSDLTEGAILNNWLVEKSVWDDL